MKKIISLIFFSLFVSVVNAQFINDSFSRLYAGYINLGIQDVATSDDGVMIGYVYDASISQAPLFVEFGGEFMFATGGDHSLKEEIFMTNVPISLLYKLGNDEINIAPMAGADLHFNGYYSIEGENYTDLINVFQGGWHVGALFSFRKFNLSYKFTGSFNELVKSSDKTSYYHTAAIGFSF